MENNLPYFFPLEIGLDHTSHYIGSSCHSHCYSVISWLSAVFLNLQGWCGWKPITFWDQQVTRMADTSPPSLRTHCMHNYNSTKPHSQGFPVFVLQFAFSIIHGSGRAVQTGLFHFLEHKPKNKNVSTALVVFTIYFLLPSFLQAHYNLCMPLRPKVIWRFKTLYQL